MSNKPPLDFFNFIFVLRLFANVPKISSNLSAMNNKKLLILINYYINL